MTYPSASSRGTRRCSTASPTGAGSRGCVPTTRRRSGGWTGSATASSRPSAPPVEGELAAAADRLREKRPTPRRHPDLAARPSGRRVPMRLRGLGAAALLVSAAVHLYLWFDGVRNQSVGPMFLVNVVAGVVIAILLLRWDHWVPPFLTAGFGAATLGAFIIASTVGLLGVHTTWAGGSVWLAAVSEI